ncbi:Peroxisome biosynthesis protein pex1 [Coemansia javaensis]|uniref:Peroxisomal ATPase PEX1 n=1 Tax=Coemansia javaensis TaxID=2761396 RepID=A0A9W8LJD4_9FUNG|nr:Peroxisome biosynthesis protein pex1 [Coemansia javaensis]
MRSCMVNLPPRWAAALSERPAGKGCMVFRISWGERSAYVAWSGGVSRADEQRDRLGVLSADGVLEIDGAFGSRLGLRDREAVAVEYEPDVGTCTAAEVVPAHFDDWEILQLNAGAVEAGLLAQARAVAVGQPMVFWLNPSTSVTLTATSVTPRARVCLLDNDTEVAVAPKVRGAGLADAGAAEPHGPGAADKPAPICCLRAAAGEGVAFGTVRVHPGSAIVAGRAARGPGRRGLLVRIGHSTAARAVPGSGDPGRWLLPWLARLDTSEAVQPGVLLASAQMLAAAGYSVGELVRVQRVSGDVAPVERPAALSFVCGQQPGAGSSEVRLALRRALGQSKQLVLNVGVSVLGDDGAALGRLAAFRAPGADEPVESAEVPVCLAADDLAAVEIACAPEPLSLDSDGGGGGGAQPGTAGAQEDPPALAGIDEFLGEAWQCVEGALMSRSGGGGGGILVCGRRGSGRTSVARHLARRVQRQQRSRLVYCRHVDCTQLSMEHRTSAVRDELQAIARDVLTNQPSLLVLDGLDSLLPAETEQGDARRVRQLADALVGALDARDGRRVVVLATGGGRAQLHARLFAAGVFQSVLEIPAPGKAERELVLAAVARRNATPADAQGVGLAALAYLTEGYMPADLHELYERAVHEATMRVLARAEAEAGAAAATEADVVVTHADLVRAHAGFRPMSLRGVQLQSSQTRWADIGGLEDTRRQLRETLELPTRYAAIFAASPLRLRSGVLLFGFPGCGKTLLASAIARECGLNFIATKGPELLSKYIGSSEQSVRDLFKRAVAASPCVLFFDEFESIAPRRGHDNTGVTDRVVNQFLTEMDGAEGLRGVYVLAATSRPDLIDPALLRPGRLDKAFLCGMPDAGDRLDILRCHAAKVAAADCVDWPQIARRTDGFTGADLQALVYNAFLEAVHEAAAERGSATSPGAAAAGEPGPAEFTVLADPDRPLSPAERAQLAERLLHLFGSSTRRARGAAGPAEGAAATTGADRPPAVTMAHFERALRTTQSSLAAQDRARFEAIYSDFVGSKKEPRPPVVEQRATMA